MKSKKELYKDEQNIIINKLINILQLDSNNSLILYDLDNNYDKQEKIYELIPEIKQYFKVGSVKSLTYPEQMKRVYLSVIKLVIKNEYNMFTKDLRIVKNEDIIRTKKYFIIKK